MLSLAVRVSSSAGVPVARRRPASIATVIEALRLIHVGGGHQHAHLWAIPADALDQLPELRPRQRVDAGGGFVEDQQIGVVDQRAAEAELLLHATGQLARRALDEGCQPCAAGQLGDAPVALVGSPAEQPAKEFEVLEHRQRWVEVLAQALRHVGDARAHRATVAGIAHVAVEHPHPALLQLARAGDQRQQAGLADAVRADQANHATGWQVDAEIVQCAGLAVLQADTRDLRHRRERLVHGVTLTCRWAGHSASASSLT